MLRQPQTRLRLPLLGARLISVTLIFGCRNYFDTQGLEFCTFDVQNEHPNCPLYRPVVRMYFDVADVSGEGFGVDAVRDYDARGLVNMLENQFAGINRFRIVTRDDQVVSQELATFRQQQGDAAADARAAEQRILAPDYVIKLDTLRSVKNQGSITGWMDYSFEITASVLNPFSREIMAYPNLGKSASGLSRCSRSSATAVCHRQ